MESMMLKNRAYLFAAIAIALYWVAVLFIPVKLLIEVLTAMAVGISAAVVFHWLPNAIDSFKEGAPFRWQRLQIAVVLLFGGIVLQRFLGLTYRWLGRPEWITDHPVSGFITYIAVLGIVMYLYVSGQEKENMTIWLLSGAMLGGALFIAGWYLTELCPTRVRNRKNLCGLRHMIRSLLRRSV
jgi:hypothetical protein